MSMKLKAVTLAALAALGIGLSGHALADDHTVKVGFITDLSGVYADLDGPGGIEAIKMAISDFGGTVNGKKIELLIADHQNKADIASSKAREWYDNDKVSLVIGGTNSSASLAIAKVAADKRKVFISAGSGTTLLTNEECNAYSVQYTYDTLSVARVTGSAVARQGDAKTWFFLTADLAFGHSLEKDSADTARASGAEVLGSVRHPLAAPDFSSFLIQAQASKAKVLGLATGGNDLVNAIKSANEFGINKKMKVVAPLMFISDIHALGLPMTQGLYYTDGWYWDQDEDSRKWAKRFYERMKKMPTMFHAGDYSATLHYLNAVKALKSTDADKVMAWMRENPVNDMFAKGGVIRPDGRMVHDLLLMQVKSPSESKYPWDYAKIIQKVPGDQAFGTKAESRCSLWK
jgi:branched-chain amino acid transport system substrate-binding protein